ncbi:hypothetical protein [Xylella fastidiosa]|uniref:hypothetical protein n=2 Tax=Xylella fastidiosa TaxID=2371 RepID=UPI00235CBEE3|nr:hypothetical protein [Xylella fastidiosa]MDD0873211.1 hypothetical protein [Xylella fastidiosa subsp. multiplex]MDD0880708.1 hypothetical protein [Xylella fastidiosa subsp. multiplex]MDD0888383.1 hypothetical protein [Xylella fastidiosa subsp. multiplex]MDD0900233.1 hypothetical protein [Xylella fastidiosa subsp. multiplex]MDD0903526.1 hypothetical protein [Xylella fastidiosa subsp. multiplex]
MGRLDAAFFIKASKKRPIHTFTMQDSTASAAPFSTPLRCVAALRMWDVGCGMWDVGCGMWGSAEHCRKIVGPLVSCWRCDLCWRYAPGINSNSGDTPLRAHG